MWGKWEKEVNALVEIMKKAIPLTLNAQKNLNQQEIKLKNDGTFVSICDFATQALIMYNINKLLPGDDVLGEEDMTKTTPEFLDMVKSLLPPEIEPVSACSRAIRQINPENHRTWVVDPIDGTEGFVHQSAYAIASCLLVDLKPQVSITAWPLHDPKYTGIEMEGPVIFIAIEGGKSYVMDLNNNIKEMPVVKTPEKAHLSNTVGPRQQYMKDHLGIPNTISLVSMVKSFILAAGKANVYIRMHKVPENVWDIAPYEIFLRNCGGIITLGNGKPIEYLPNGKVKDSADLGIVNTIGGKEWHEHVLKVYKQCRKEMNNYIIE